MNMGRILAWVVLAGVLALAFAGYLRANMVVQWDSLMALCGL